MSPHKHCFIKIARIIICKSMTTLHCYLNTNKYVLFSILVETFECAMLIRRYRSDEYNTWSLRTSPFKVTFLS